MHLILHGMPVKKIKKDKIPAATRDRRSALQDIQEWKDVLAILAVGLKPLEAVEVVIPPETITRIGIKNAVRIFTDLVRAHCRRLGLSYDVFQRRTEHGKCVYIVGR
jgi:hypothetical protein